MKAAVFSAALLWLLCAGTVTAAPPMPRYSVVPLETLPGGEAGEAAVCLPRALNNHGESVGTVQGRNRLEAVRWDSQGRIALLGKPPKRLGIAEGLNDSGQVLAYTTAAEPSSAARLFLLDKSGTHSVLPPAGMTPAGFTGGEAINRAGQIVFNTQEGHAFLLSAGTVTNLGRLPLAAGDGLSSQVHVRALNSLGMAAGGSRVTLEAAGKMPVHAFHAFLWRQGTMTDLGVPPGYSASTATALSDTGEVIGTMTRDGEGQAGVDPASQTHGFLWRSGAIIDLQALPGCRYTEPTGINREGLIVGNSYNLTGDSHGFSRTGGALNGGVFLWAHGKMQNLQALVPARWKLQSAVGINNRGEILCTGYYDGMPSRTISSGALLLRPRGLSQK